MCHKVSEHSVNKEDNDRGSWIKHAQDLCHQGESTRTPPMADERPAPRAHFYTPKHEKSRKNKIKPRDSAKQWMKLLMRTVQSIGPWGYIAHQLMHLRVYCQEQLLSSTRYMCMELRVTSTDPSPQAIQKRWSLRGYLRGWVKYCGWYARNRLITWEFR